MLMYRPAGLAVRSFATATRAMRSEAMRSYLALQYDAPGEPLDVLKLKSSPTVSSLSAGQVLVGMIKAPINPSDINTVQGKYPIQPTLPGGIPGHEGVGKILEVGPQVTGLAEGDLVVPLEPGQGTWRQAGVFSAQNWHKLPKDLDIDQAATLCINPPTALAMLEQFVKLEPGEVVIQNGGTSAVGQLVSQLARAKGLKTVSVIRPRSNMDETVQKLKSLGADLVTTEERLKQDLKDANLGPAPRLGLNCVGGSSALAVCKALADGGTLVTYGGMSMQPVTVPTSLLIFKDLAFRGFWLSGRFAAQQGHEERGRVLDRLAELIMQGKLHTKCKTIPLKEYESAFKAATSEHKDVKVLLDMA